MKWYMIVAIVLAGLIALLAIFGWITDFGFATIIFAFAIGMFGIFVVYPTGGLHTVSVIAVAVMILSYFAVGPYAGYFAEFTDQIKAPIKALQFNIGIQTGDIWDMITNPTQYYRNQQLRAARSELPSSYPAAVEINTIQIVPDGTIPANSEFGIFALFKNEGTFKVRNVKIKAECIESNLKGANSCIPKTIELPPQPELDREDIIRGDFVFTARGRTDSRAGETVFNKVNITVEYSTETNSTLKIERATHAEIQRRLREKTAEKAYYPQIAVAKVGPAQIGMNMGPQPLEAGVHTLILSIFSTRPDGEIILKNPVLKADGTPETKDSILFINASVGLGDKLVCETKSGYEVIADECTGTNDKNGNSICKIKITQEKGLSYSKPLPIVCSFEIAPLTIASAQTGIITATLDNYIYKHGKEKSIPVGPSLETAFDRIADTTQHGASVSYQ